MYNKKTFQESINRSLSGLRENPYLAQRVIAQAKRERKVKKKVVVFAVLAAVLIASVALAEYANLFNLFGERDERYRAIAPYATLTTSENVVVQNEALGTAVAAIDSAYYDGLSLSMAYRIVDGQKTEEYEPTGDALSSMEVVEASVLALDGNEPDIVTLQTWNKAIENGTPYGYRNVTVYTSDHTTTDDGIDIFHDSVEQTFNSKGEFCEMRVLECPLPDEIRERQELSLNIDVHQQTVYNWFDGTNCYRKIERMQLGTMTAVIPRNGESRRYAGKGEIGGVACTVTAEISQMAAVVRFDSAAPMDTFLNASFGETKDYWPESVAIDENGNTYRLNEFIDQVEDDGFTALFDGTGVVPEMLTIYVYTMSDESDIPDISILEGITITATQ